MRPAWCPCRIHVAGISIHASRMGCDGHDMHGHDRIQRFQSTHPVWDATASPRGRDRQTAISIHASRMGCDIEQQPISAFREFQSTHPVWDATARTPVVSCTFIPFQSTHPVWDATCAATLHHSVAEISIHASRMGCDQTVERLLRSRVDFNPRIPYGMRLPSYAVQYRSN